MGGLVIGTTKIETMGKRHLVPFLTYLKVHSRMMPSCNHRRKFS